MLTPDAVCSIFAYDPVPGVSNPYHGQYKSLLCDPFPVVQFAPSLLWLDNGFDTMTVRLKTSRTIKKPIFVFLIAPNNAAATSGDAEATMVRLLKEADGPDIISVMHGVCVFETKAAFYEYDRKKQTVSPKPQGQVHYDFDLATQSGAVRFVEVAEEVMRMCRELIPDLEVPAYLDIPDSVE
jgi:hypothetical protein